MNIKEKILEKIRFISKKEIIGGALIAILIVGGVIYFLIEMNGMFEREEEFMIEESIIDSKEINDFETDMSKEKNKIKVYITGEVNSPGVIEIDEGERIEDVIEKAAGITENADLRKVNLAYKLEDGQKIYIPNVNDSDEENIISTENGENVIQNFSESSKSGKVNINTASVEKLCEIPGIGETMAQKIVVYREENGKFKTIEDLKNVSGIGEKKFESMREYIETK